MNDLVTWFRAQLDEDARVAREATQGRWKLWGMEVRADIDGTSDFDTSLAVARTSHHAGWLTFNAQHIARWDPAHALAEVDAKRKLIELYCLTAESDELGSDAWTVMKVGIKTAALPYADRPGYLEEWRP